MHWYVLFRDDLYWLVVEEREREEDEEEGIVAAMACVASGFLFLARQIGRAHV